MPIQRVNIAPGMYREGTAYTAEGRWYDGDKVRFRAGLPEKLGGWVRLSDDTFIGVARSLVSWVSLTGRKYLGIGTHLKYYIEDGGVYADITPIRKTSSPMASNPVATAYGALAADMDATQDSLTLADATSFPPTGGVIQIGSETIRYNEVSGTTILAGLERGYAGTTATTHTTSDPVGCSTVVVTDANHEAGDNDFVTYSGATGPVNEFTADMLNAEHQVFRYINTSTYAVNIEGVFSTAVATGGGSAMVAAYQVNVGLDTFVVGLGWGTDPWGAGGWGVAGVVGIEQQLRLWTADNFGEDLVFAPRNGAIYYWDASNGSGTRGSALSDLATAAGYDGQFVPRSTSKVLASAIQRFVIALGANGYDPGDPLTVFDPMLVRWSDQENPFEWVPAVTNQSGEFRLSHGSYIVTAASVRQENLIWTDSALYTMQYLGPPYVWGINVLMENISIISPNAVAIANNIVFWMGKDKFYTYSGRVETLPCDLRQYIFNDLNKSQAYQVFAGSNEAYNEVWWFYCSQNSSTVDKYVIYNYLENVWYYGTMARTAWLDSPIRDYPMAADYNNRVLYHEAAVDDVSGLSPVPINAYVQSADFDIDDGHRFSLVTRALPDINFNGSSVNTPSIAMTLKARRNAGSAYMQEDTVGVASADDYATTRLYTIQQFDGQVYVRVRGRQMSVRFESTGLGVAWQIGSIRLDIRPDGRQ